MSDDISAERKFLHDIATPIATAIFLADALLDSLGTTASPDDLAQLKAVLDSLMGAKKSLEARRAILIAQMEKK